jgi:alpha-L-fucosidase
LTIDRREFTYSLIAVAAWAVGVRRLSASPSTGHQGKSLLLLQQDFLDLRFGMYIHLNMATYEQREWGDPKASPRLFNPVHLDTDQWAEAALSANMMYGCLTTPRFSEPYGPQSRIASYQVQRWEKGAWIETVSGRTPAKFQIHQFPRARAERVRLTITGSEQSPGIAEFGIYDEPPGK